MAISRKCCFPHGWRLASPKSLTFRYRGKKRMKTYIRPIDNNKSNDLGRKTPQKVIVVACRPNEDEEWLEPPQSWAHPARSMLWRARAGRRAGRLGMRRIAGAYMSRNSNANDLDHWNPFWCINIPKCLLCSYRLFLLRFHALFLPEA